jgi:hypothetical protein
MAKKPVCSLLEHLTLAAASVRCTAIDGQMVAPLCCKMKLRTIVSYSPFIFFPGQVVLCCNPAESEH